MTTAGTRLRADMLRIVASVPGLFHKHRQLLLGSDLVQHVVQQAGEDPVPTVALSNPQSAFSEAETAGKLDDLGVWRDDVIKCRVSFRNRERLRHGGRAVTTHLWPSGTALRLHGPSGQSQHDAPNYEDKRWFHTQPL